MVELYILEEKMERLEEKIDKIDRMLTFLLDSTLISGRQMIPEEDKGEVAEEIDDLTDLITDEMSDIYREFMDRFYEEEETYEDEEEEDEN